MSVIFQYKYPKLIFVIGPLNVNNFFPIVSYYVKIILFENKVVSYYDLL